MRICPKAAHTITLNVHCSPCEREPFAFFDDAKLNPHSVGYLAAMFALACIAVGVLIFAIWNVMRKREREPEHPYQGYPELHFDERCLIAQYAIKFSRHFTLMPVSAQFLFRMAIPIREKALCNCGWKNGVTSSRIIKIACSEGPRASKYLGLMVRDMRDVILGYKDGAVLRAIMGWYHAQALPLPELGDDALKWALRARGPSVLRALLAWAPEHRKVKPIACILAGGDSEVSRVIHQNMYQACGDGAALKVQILTEHGHVLKQALARPANATAPVDVPPREREDAAPTANAEQARVLAPRE